MATGRSRVGPEEIAARLRRKLARAVPGPQERKRTRFKNSSLPRFLVELGEWSASGFDPQLIGAAGFRSPKARGEDPAQPLIETLRDLAFTAGSPLYETAQSEDVARQTLRRIGEVPLTLLLGGPTALALATSILEDFVLDWYANVRGDDYAFGTGLWLTGLTVGDFHRVQGVSDAGTLWVLARGRDVRDEISARRDRVSKWLGLDALEGAEIEDPRILGHENHVGYLRRRGLFAFALLDASASHYTVIDLDDYQLDVISIDVAGQTIHDIVTSRPDAAAICNGTWFSEAFPLHSEGHLVSHGVELPTSLPAVHQPGARRTALDDWLLRTIEKAKGLDYVATDGSEIYCGTGHPPPHETAIGGLRSSRQLSDIRKLFERNIGMSLIAYNPIEHVALLLSRAGGLESLGLEIFFDIENLLKRLRHSGFVHYRFLDGGSSTALSVEKQIIVEGTRHRGSPSPEETVTSYVAFCKKGARPEPEGVPNSALVVFHENSGRIPLTQDLPPQARQFIERKLDYFVEEFEKWHLEFENSVGVIYRRVVQLEDELATEQHFRSTVIELAENGYQMDVITIGHGGHEVICGFQNSDITDDTLMNLFFDRGKLPFRAVYMVNCVGSSMNPHWLHSGARVSAGSRRNNYMPEPMLHLFWRGWRQGWRFDRAVSFAFEEAKLWWEPIYEAGAKLGLIEDQESLIEDSEPVIDGDPALTIYSNL